MSTSRFETFIAIRYLKSRRKELFISINAVISVLGVAISVLVLDMVLSIMTGFETELRDKLIGANAHVVVRRTLGYVENWEEVQRKATRVDGVLAAFPYTYNQAMLSTAGGARGMIIRGVAQHPDAKEKVAQYLEEGSSIDALFAPAKVDIFRPDGTPDVVELPPLLVGRELRRRFGLPMGVPVTLFSPSFTSSPQGLIPKQRRFVAVGSYSSGLVEYENGLAYTSLPAAQAFFGLQDSVTGIELIVDDLYKAKEIGDQVIQALGGAESGFYATDWTEPNKPLWDALKMEKRVYFIVLLLLILVASFSVISTLVMVVMEKGRDIAILKSMGASDSSIARIFITQGALIGFVGTLLGTVLGFLGCVALREYGFELDRSVFSLDQVPVLMLPENFALVAVASFLITTLAGYYPARRASKLNPAEALRYE